MQGGIDSSVAVAVWGPSASACPGLRPVADVPAVQPGCLDVPAGRFVAM
jgi:hypothetical protein